MKTITKKAYGKNIKITDARDNFDLAINNAKGNTEQDTTSGKNLLDCSGLVEKTVAGVTFTPVFDNRGLLEYINVNGTNDGTGESNYHLSAGKFPLKAGKTYRLTGCPTGGSTSTYRLLASQLKADTGGGGDGTPTQDYDGAYVSISVYSGYKANNLKFYPMIRYAENGDDTYEPFTNGASPNPSYPQEIKSVVLSEIKTCGKNLLNMAGAKGGTANGITVEMKDDGSYSYVGKGEVEVGTVNVWLLGGYTRTEPLFTLSAGTYYIKDVCLYYNKTNIVTSSRNGTFITLTKDTPVGGVRAVEAEYGVAVNKTCYPIIARSKVEVDWEPYTESVATLSNPITMNGFNGVWDTLESKKFKTVVFDGSESGWKQSSTYNTRYFINISDAVKNGAVLCTQGIRRDSTQNGSIRIDGNLNFSIDTTFTTLAEWKAHLASNPMIVVYELAEPIETPLPEADVEALKSLKTYDGVTHIFTDSEIEPTLEVEYTLLEAKNEWSYTDYFQHTDYNRIAGNINYLKDYLDTLFYGLTNTLTIEEKTAKSLIYAREINAIETALETLNLETYKFDIGETKEYMANTRTLNFEDLNRIESAIFMLAEQMTNHKENLSRLAFRLGEQKGIRV